MIACCFSVCALGHCSFKSAGFQRIAPMIVLLEKLCCKGSYTLVIRCIRWIPCQRCCHWRQHSLLETPKRCSKVSPFVDSVRLGSALVSLMMVDICPAWIIWKKVTCEQLIPWEFHIMTNGLVMFSRNSTSLSTNMIAQLQPQQKIVLNVTFSRHVCSLNWIQLQKTWLWERQWTNTRKIVTWQKKHENEVSSWKWTLKVLNGRFLLNLTFKHCPTFDNWWSNFMVSNGKIAMQNTSLQWSACTKQAFRWSMSMGIIAVMCIARMVWRFPRPLRSHWMLCPKSWTLVRIRQLLIWIWETSRTCQIFRSTSKSSEYGLRIWKIDHVTRACGWKTMSSPKDPWSWYPHLADFVVIVWGKCRYRYSYISPIPMDPSVPNHRGLGACRSRQKLSMAFGA